MSNLFRKSSIEEISSPEQLNQYICVTHIGSWVVISAILIIAVGVIIWSFIGNITVGINSTGIVFPQKGSTSIVTKSSGFITDIRVKVGDYVAVGDVIAIIPQNDILRQIDEGRIAKENVEALQGEYMEKSMIVSEYNGRIMSVIDSDKLLQVGDKVAEIILESNNYNDKEIICYVPLSEVGRLEIGMEAEVSPTFAPREEYGYMNGYISKIGTYPVTINDAKNYLGNFAFKDELFPSTNFTEVRITLMSDETSANNIKWSNPRGSNVPVDIGNTCEILVITEKNKPIELLF